MRSQVVRRGHERVRVGPWRGDRHVAFVAPIGDAVPPSAEMIEHACRVLAARGYERVITGALGAREQRGFLDAGFRAHDELHLLAHDLSHVPDVPPARLRRGLRVDRRAALAADAAAFAPFWRLDAAGLREAIGATPVARFRVATHRVRVIGYAVTGRAGRRGYLQRLAVHPDHTGRGLGAALVVDGLRWLQRGGAEEAIVNTQAGNTRALHLYERLGFRLEPSGLTVLERHLMAQHHAT